MLSTSRWLVGSSSTTTLFFTRMSFARSSRAASPPERFSVFFRPASPLKSSLPSTDAHVLDLARSGRSGAATRRREKPGFERLVVVLREVADVRLVAPDDRAGVGLVLADEQLEQRRLADAARPDHRELVAAVRG